jgi:predicted nucleic acid-binding protein
MAFVLDSSFAVAVALEEVGADAGGDRIAAQGAVVPILWRWEVANALLMAVRRGRLAESKLPGILEGLSALPVAIDDDSAARAWTDTLRLAVSAGLTAYDAAYLELAQRLGAPLATLDRKLAQAARLASLEVIGAEAAN